MDFMSGLMDEIIREIIHHPALIVIQVFLTYNGNTKAGLKEGLRVSEDKTWQKCENRLMALIEYIPARFFSILVSEKRELYVEALFVLRQAFKTELVIRREDLTAMLMGALETSILQADFSEEAEEMGTGKESIEDISGRAHLLIRKLRDTGRIEIEYERGGFDENITIPDYAIAVINLLYDLSCEKTKEYNS